MSGSERLAPPVKADYPYSVVLQPRWNDNDVYGHLNNTVYYEFFDSVVNGWLVAQGVLDLEESTAIGLVVETRCAYFSPLAYPDPVTVGLALQRLGRTSIRYDLGVFAQDGTPAARGRFTHVYVARDSRRPVSVPDTVARAVARLKPAAT